MRFRSARLTDETLVSQIDDFVGELENDIAQIFGFTPDEDITESPFGCDNSGRITRALLRFSQGIDIGGVSIPTQGGILIEDTGADIGTFGVIPMYGSQDGAPATRIGIFYLGEVDTLRTSKNPYQLDDSWGTGFGVLMDHGGQLYGPLFSSSSKGLTPRGSGSSGEFLCADGTYRAAGVPSSNAHVNLPVRTDGGSGTTGLPTDTTFSIFWSDEVNDSQGWHSIVSGTDRVTVDETGNYLISARFRTVPETYSSWSEIKSIAMRVVVNSTTVVAETLVPFNQDTSPGALGGPPGDIDTIVGLSSGDYVTVDYVVTTSTSGADTVYWGTSPTEYFLLVKRVG